MKHVLVMGLNCSTCRKAHQRIADTAQRLGLTVNLEKTSDPAQLMAWGILRPPGVVVDGKLVYFGGVPSVKQIETWLR